MDGNDLGLDPDAVDPGTDLDLDLAFLECLSSAACLTSPELPCTTSLLPVMSGVPDPDLDLDLDLVVDLGLKLDLCLVIWDSSTSAI
jgi:hypothetical protein